MEIVGITLLLIMVSVPVTFLYGLYLIITKKGNLRKRGIHILLAITISVLAFFLIGYSICSGVHFGTH